MVANELVTARCLVMTHVEVLENEPSIRLVSSAIQQSVRQLPTGHLLQRLPHEANVELIPSQDRASTMSCLTLTRPCNHKSESQRWHEMADMSLSPGAPAAMRRGEHIQAGPDEQANLRRRG